MVIPHGANHRYRVVREKAKSFVKGLFADPEQITFFPTYGYREGSGWNVPLRAWVHEPRSLVTSAGIAIIESFGEKSEAELKRFRSRFSAITADSESRERVAFIFAGDTKRKTFRIESEEGTAPRSDLNGIIEGSIFISDTEAMNYLSDQNSDAHWLTIEAVSKDHSGTGRIQLIESEGVSIISDIDDTLKVTEIFAGGRVVVDNTFFKAYEPTPEMYDIFERYRGASVHYVSGAPYQLYDPLAEFLRREGFPEGTFHMKHVPTNLLSLRSWKSLVKLLGDATVQQKTNQIEEIVRRFPNRTFIFIGDSGEHDPEIYRHLKDQFSDQVQEIIIRDVVNARTTNPERLEGMTVIPAATKTRRE